MFWRAEFLMFWMISIENCIDGKNMFYLLHQQNLSCWCKRLQSLGFQNSVRAWWVDLITFVLARILESISVPFRLPFSFLQKQEIASLTTEMGQWKLSSFCYSWSSWNLQVARQGWISACPAVLTDCVFQKQISWKENLERFLTRKLPVFQVHQLA